MNVNRRRLKRALQDRLEPLAAALSRAGLTANQLTVAGLVFGALSGLSFAMGQAVGAVFWIIVSGLCDMLDGAVARVSGRGGTPFGAVLDSGCDRLGEAFVLAGLLIGKVNHGGGATNLWFFIWAMAFTGSFLVSYMRARAEGVGCLS
jgi:archaetidylinositol phosphate synthase